MLKKPILILLFSLFLSVGIKAQETELSIQTGHVAVITKIVFSPDGSFLASSDNENKICIWDMSGLTQMASFFYSNLLENDSITLLAFSLDNKKLIVGTVFGNLLVWDIGKSEKIRGFAINNRITKLLFIDNSTCLIVSSNLLSLNLDNNLISEVSNLKIADLYVNPQTNEILFCSFDGSVGKIINQNGLKLQLSSSNIETQILLARKLLGVAKVKLTNKIIATSNLFNLRFYDFESKRRLFSASMPYLDEYVTDIEFLPKSNLFVVSNTDGKIYVYDCQKKKLARILKDHISAVNSLAVHPSKNIFASGSSDRSIILWDALTFKPIKRFYARASAIECIALSESKDLLAFGNELGYTKLINLTDKYNEIRSVKNHQQPVNDLEFANSDKTLYTCSNDNHISKLNIDNLKIEKYKKVKTNIGFRYLMNNVIVKLKMYVEPTVFVDSISMSADKRFVVANGYKVKQKSKKTRSTKIIRSVVPYKKQFEFCYSSADLKKIKGIKYVKEVDADWVKVDSIISGVEVYNKKNGHISKITAAKFDKMKNRLITSSKDATIKIWDVVTKKLIITIIPVDKEKRIFITADNYYFAPKNALNAIGFKQGIHFYPPEQFDLKYNRPDKVLEQLDNPDTNLINLYRKAYQKRLKKSGFTEQMFSTDWHTPEIRILNSDNFNYTTNNQQQKLRVCGIDRKFKLDRLNVWINDVPVFGINGISLRSENTDSVLKEFTIMLSAGNNKIQVSCFNVKGIESLKETVEIFYKPETMVKPDLYIISMSVSEYKDKRYNLQYAVKDGKDIANLLNSQSVQLEKYNKIYIDTLFNANATRQNFFYLKKKLLGSSVNDQVIVFVSGHGLLNKDMDFYFATYDIDFSHPEKHGISFDDLESLLDSIPARKKLLMMDACHSGEVDKDESTEMFASKVESSADITFRGSIKEYNFKGVDTSIIKSGMKLNNSFELMQELFAGLDKGTGTIVISAAAGKGYALESAKWNNGVFTYSIINGLKNKAADKNKDGFVSISELKDYSIKQVELLTGGKQKPTARRETIGFDWRIW